MKTTIILSTLASLAAVYADDCPAPGATGANGDVGCSPTQSYPNQACALVGGCNVIRGLGGVVPTSTGSSPAPQASCPAVGATDAAGDKGCNPADDYSAQQQACALVGGCYVLRGLGAIVPTSTGNGQPMPQPTTGTWPAHTSMVVVAGGSRFEAAGIVAAGLVAMVL